MKKNILKFILCSVGIISCTTQNFKTTETSSSKPVSKEIIKDSTCCFDIKKYNERRIKEGHYDFEFEENGKIIRQLSDTPERDSPDSLREYREEISKQWSPFIIRKKYDSKGRMIRWSTTFRLESIGKSYEYDKNGNVIKTTNYEERYKHSFADIREFLLKKKGIDIYDTRQAIARRVNHRNETPSEVFYDIQVLHKGGRTIEYYMIIMDDTLEIKEYRD